MSIYAKSGGSWRTITGVWRKMSGTWQPIASVSSKVSGTWENVFGTMTVTVNTETADGYDEAPGSPESNSVTATVDGGTAPYSYQWIRVSGDTGITINNPTSATTNFMFTNATSSFVLKIAVYHCRVTDADSIVVYSPEVTVTLESSN